MVALSDTERMIVDTVHEFVEREVRPLRPGDRARQRVPRGDDRADEGARHLRARHPRVDGRVPGLDAVLRPRHRGARPRVDEPGRGDGRPHRRVQAARRVRHRGAAGDVPAADGDGRGPRHDGAHRAGRRLRPAGDAHGRPPRRRPLRRQRLEDVDHQRPPLAADRADVQDRPGGDATPPRREHPARRARPGADRVQGPAEARLQGRRELRADLRGLPRAGRRAARRRGGARLPADDAGPRDRPHPGRVRAPSASAGRRSRTPCSTPRTASRSASRSGGTSRSATTSPTWPRS